MPLLCINYYSDIFTKVVLSLWQGCNRSFLEWDTATYLPRTVIKKAEGVTDETKSEKIKDT